MAIDSFPFNPYDSTPPAARLASWHALVQRRLHGAEYGSQKHSESSPVQTSHGAQPVTCHCPPQTSYNNSLYRVSGDTVDGSVDSMYMVTDATSHAAPQSSIMTTPVMPLGTYTSRDRDLQLLIAINAVILIITLFVSFRTLGVVNDVAQFRLPALPNSFPSYPSYPNMFGNVMRF